MEKITIPVEDTNNISDGYHTFGELYEHRITLFIALCKAYAQMDLVTLQLKTKAPIFYIWKSNRHSDGGKCFGGEDWFVLGIGKEKGKQITYHIPMDKWNEVNFAEPLYKAPEFDGHTPGDVLERIKNL